MVFVWTGRGFLVPIIAFASLLLLQLGVDAAFGDDYYKQNEWPKYAAIVLAAVACWFVGRMLNKGEGKAAHTLFFVPMQYWAFLILALGLILGLDSASAVQLNLR